MHLLLQLDSSLSVILVMASTLTGHLLAISMLMSLRLQLGKRIRHTLETFSKDSQPQFETGDTVTTTTKKINVLKISWSVSHSNDFDQCLSYNPLLILYCNNLIYGLTLIITYKDLIWWTINIINSSDSIKLTSIILISATHFVHEENY